MNITSFDQMLNDKEINLLADLFLHCFGFDRNAKRYRYFREAIVLLSRGAFRYTETMRQLSAYEHISYSYLMKELRAAVERMPRPVHLVYNETYAGTPDGADIPNDRPTMSDCKKLSYVMSFLSTSFLYIILSDYPKYNFIDVRQFDSD